MKEFFDILKDKIGLNSISDDKYKENQTSIESFSKLKFSSYEEDLELRKENLDYHTVRYKLIIFIMFFLSILCFVLFKEAIFFWGVYIFSILIVYLFMRYLILKCPRICLIVLPLLFMAPLNFIFSALKMDNNQIKLVLLLISMFLALISFNLYKLLPKYIVGEISETVTIVLTFIAIFSKVLPFDKIIFFNLILVEIGVNLNFIELTRKFVMKEDIIIAEKYFREELLSSKPSYKKLIQCYGKGGASYKEKILSNEKFLRIIEQEENKN